MANARFFSLESDLGLHGNESKLYALCRRSS